MGRKPESADAGVDLEQLAEILDEDHLEFEDLLIDIRGRTGLLDGQIKALARQLSDARGETLEMKEMVENLETKVDRLLTLLAERPHDP